MAEIVIIHGYAGSGKSTQCTRIVRDGFRDFSIQHISAGNVLRGIRTGVTPSAFSDIINAPDAQYPLPEGIVSGVLFESIQEDHLNVNPALVLIDGYPRHPNAVELFRSELRDRSHRLLGAIAMQVPMEVSVERLLLRGQRAGERVSSDTLENFAIERYDLDRKTTNFAIEALSKFVTVETVNAVGDVDSVYTNFRASLERLILKY